MQDIHKNPGFERGKQIATRIAVGVGVLATWGALAGAVKYGVDFQKGAEQTAQSVSDESNARLAVMLHDYENIREQSVVKDLPAELTNLNNGYENEAEGTPKPIEYKDDEGKTLGVLVPDFLKLPDYISEERRQKILELGSPEPFTDAEIQNISQNAYPPYFPREARPADQQLITNYVKVDATRVKDGVAVYATPEQFERFAALTQELDKAQKESTPGYKAALRHQAKIAQAGEDELARVRYHGGGSLSEATWRRAQAQAVESEAMQHITQAEEIK
jgi:hypothetical protein